MIQNKYLGKAKSLLSGKYLGKSKKPVVRLIFRSGRLMDVTLSMFVFLSLQFHVIKTDKLEMGL